MPQFEQRENSGTLFKNDKGDNDKRPDYKGDCNIYGDLFEIGAWIKEGKNGKFMSLSFKPKEDRPLKVAPKADFSDMGDDIPF